MEEYTLKINAVLMALRYKWGFPPNLAGACGHGAYSLHKLTGISCHWGYVGNISHCWCEHNGVIYDPTAEQVGLPFINTLGVYKSVHPVTDIADFFDFWQPPTNKDINLIIRRVR